MPTWSHSDAVKNLVMFDAACLLLKSTTSPQRCFLLEWGGGLFVCDLVERLEEYSDEDGRTIAWRSLKVPRAHREQIEDRMEAFVHRLLNDPARHDNQAMPLKSVLPAVRHQLNVLGRGVRHARHEVVEDLSALFCSKTVAVCYKAAGLLHKTRHASDFLPKHWSADFDYMLQLRGGAVLAPEVVLTFESELQRGLLLRFLALADLGRVDRDRSARWSTRAASSPSARRTGFVRSSPSPSAPPPSAASSSAAPPRPAPPRSSRSATRSTGCSAASSTSSRARTTSTTTRSPRSTRGSSRRCRARKTTRRSTFRFCRVSIYASAHNRSSARGAGIELVVCTAISAGGRWEQEAAPACAFHPAQWPRMK